MSKKQARPKPIDDEEKEKLTFEVHRSFRTTAVGEKALDSLVYKAKASGRLSWKKDAKITQEAVCNAIWLWLDDMDPTQFIEALEVYVPKLKEQMLARTLPAQAGAKATPLVSSGEGIPSTKKKPRNNAG